MINIESAKGILRQRYPDLEAVGDGIFRGFDRHADREYAVRYFDLNDDLTQTSKSIKSYQEQVLSDAYFSSQSPTDLRWNHYLYFVTSAKQAESSEFNDSKTVVESDREYARKQVVLEEDLARVISPPVPAGAKMELPPDLASTWTKRLDARGMGFVLDDRISVPEVVRRIAAGQKESSGQVALPTALLPAEAAATRSFLKHLTIHGFRPHPTEKRHALGRVNLIFGSNGVGKTSLLEAIEYAYCGKNRRPAVVSANTSVIAELVGTDEKLTSSTSTVRLRARHSNWYAKTELRTVTIEDSFGKFNFLDIDAAVRLSVANSSEQVGADVARLVLGAEAEKLEDRLRRVDEKLQDELKDLRRKVQADETLSLAAMQRRDAMKAAPKVSDGLFSELLASLEQVNWLNPPSDRLGIDTLRRDLSAVISSVGLLQRSKTDVLQSDQDSLQRFWSDLDSAAQQAGDLEDRHKSASLEAAEQARQLQTASASVAAINALVPFAQAGFSALIAQYQALRQTVNQRSVELATLSLPLQPELYAAYLSRPLAEAVAEAGAQVTALRQRTQQAQSALRSFEATQSSLTVLRERILSTAKELLRGSPDPNHCPVCNTRFEEGQLLVRMLAGSGGRTPDQLGSFRAELEQASSRLSSAETSQPALRSLADFVRKDAASLRVEEALARVKTYRTELEDDARRLSSLEDALSALAANGLTAAALGPWLSAAGYTALPPESELLVDRQFASKSESTALATVAALGEKLAQVRREAEVMATRFSLSVSSSTAELASEVLARRVSFEAAMEARQTLLTSINLGSGTTVETLASGLTACQDLLVKMVTADAQETANDAGLAKENKSIDDLKDRIKGCTKKIGYLADAEIVLAELNRQSSGDELAARILSENASEIARTFASIHLPSEFDLDVHRGRMRILRRQTNGAVELNQMSSGQRAAFALSLFLAMNSRLRTGPPVLLFDDPVAHVDDINVLSFLDHLRALAIDGTRQIFFATADSKLAGLFRQKFRFLGLDDFKEIPLTRT